MRRARRSSTRVDVLLGKRQAHQPALGGREQQRPERRVRARVAHVGEPFGGDARGSGGGPRRGRALARRPRPSRRLAGVCPRAATAAPARSCLVRSARDGSCRHHLPQPGQSLVQRAAGRLLRAADRRGDVAVGQIGDVAQHDRRALARGQLADGVPQRLVAGRPARYCSCRRVDDGRRSATGTARRDRPRWASSALRCAIVSTQARRLESARSRG